MVIAIDNKCIYVINLLSMVIAQKKRIQHNLKYKNKTKSVTTSIPPMPQNRIDNCHYDEIRTLMFNVTVNRGLH